MSTRISKSKFVAGCQCLKRLYWQVHEPELAAQPDAAAGAIIQQGHEVGMLARQLFLGGVEVDCSRGLTDAIRATRELIANPDTTAIYEAVFEHQNVLVKVDILHRRRDGRWRLIEVKSTTDAKGHHLEDVAIQYRVVSRSGVDVASACLAHVNRNYVRGEAIDAKRLFRIKNLTRRVQRLQPKLTFQLGSQFRVLAMPASPSVKSGSHCTNPVTCEFYDRCNPPLPSDHVGYLPRIQASAVEELEKLGVESSHDVPDDFPLNERQRRAAACVQTGTPWYDGAAIKKELAALKYPICYMDFETVNPAIPRFAGTRPYQPVPFQFSVHVQRKPVAEPEHYEFLALDASDPRREFITSLCDALGKKGSIVVYNAGFESQRLADLAAWLPEFGGRIKKIKVRLWDLLPLIRNCVYHPAFGGSYSLKSVLPALIPTMTYEGMTVANGASAGLAWESLVGGELDLAERELITKALLAYCGQDTLALVRLLNCVRER